MAAPEIPSSTRAKVRELNTLAAIRADPALAPFERNLYPLTGKAGETRTKIRSLGSGTFGRVNLESLTEGDVATKYFTEVRANIRDNTSEIAALKYLQDVPNVAQLIRVNARPPAGSGSGAGAGAINMPFPAAVMGKAIGSLDDRRLYRSWNDVYATMKQVLSGYYTIHSLGIVHRDTKPQNMLMTATREVWVADFGEAKYTDEHIPMTEDNYTGTYWYSAPELLMKNHLNLKRFTHKNFISSDTWAVGAVLYQLITQRPAFYGDTQEQVLQTIFQMKGTPDATDGETFDVYTEFNKSARFPAYAKTPNIIRTNIEASAVHPPANRSELSEIADIIERLLDYNPATRMTIQEALESPVFGGSVPGVPPRLTLTKQYAKKLQLPTAGAASINQRMLEEEFDKVFKIVQRDKKRRYRTDNYIAPDSRVIVLDRVGVYTLSFLNAYKGNPYVKQSNLKLIASAALLLATFFFDSNPYLVLDIAELITLSAYAFTENQLIDCIKMYMMAPIQFFGRTAFDEMVNSLPGLSPEKYDTLGLLNYICFQQSIYNHFGDADAVMGKITEYADSGTLPNTTSVFSGAIKELGFGTLTKPEIKAFRTFLGLPEEMAGGGTKKRKTRRVVRKGSKTRGSRYGLSRSGR